jgi:RNA polymerase sigma-70 factor (ECF subfamily)
MEQDKLADAILVLRCRRRDEKAFEELVNRWQPRLYYYVRRIVEDENAVWDALQETWLAVYQKIRKLEDPRKFPAWLYKISHNEAVSLLRREGKYVQMVEEQMADCFENNGTIDIAEEQAELAHKLLGKLKLAHREILTLYFLEGFSIREMAGILEVSEGTVKSRLHYAKHKMREALKGANDVWVQK